MEKSEAPQSYYNSSSSPGKFVMLVAAVQSK